MPGRDRSGPRGEGPNTGGGRGPCGGGRAAADTPPPGRGLGWRWGYGRGGDWNPGAAPEADLRGGGRFRRGYGRGGGRRFRGGGGPE